MTNAFNRAWPRVNPQYVFVHGIHGRVDARTENLKALRNQDNCSIFWSVHPFLLPNFVSLKGANHTNLSVHFWCR